MIDIRDHGGMFGGSRLQNKPLAYHKFYKGTPVPINYCGTGMIGNYDQYHSVFVNKRFSDRLFVVRYGTDGNSVRLYDVLENRIIHSFNISPYSWSSQNFGYLCDNGDFIFMCSDTTKVYLARAQYNPSTKTYQLMKVVQTSTISSGNALIVTGFRETNNYYIVTTDYPGTETTFINKTDFTKVRTVPHPSGLKLRLLEYDEQNDIVYGAIQVSENANITFVKFNGTTGNELLRWSISPNGASNGYYATSLDGIFLHPTRQYLCKVTGKTGDRTNGGLCIVYFDAVTGVFVKKVDIQDTGVVFDDDYYGVYPYVLYPDGHVLLGVTNSTYPTDVNKLMLVDINTGVIKAYLRLTLGSSALTWTAGWNFGEPVYSLSLHTMGYGTCVELYRT